MVGRRLVAVLLAMVAASACARVSEPGAPGERLVVAASFYPIAEAAERIGGGSVRVVNLTPPGTEPHDVELSSERVDQIIDADVVLYLGGGFQPAIERVVPRAGGIAVDVLEGLDPMEGADEHGDEEDAHEGEEEGSYDPHVWLDPRRWAGAAHRIGELLAEADAQGADGYRTRAEAYAGGLRTLDEEFERALASCERDLLVTSHAAFGYLAARYGLTQEAISGISPEAEPDPRRLSDLTDLVEREGVTTIFTEPLVPVDVARTLARESGAEVSTLDPIEGLTPEQVERGEDYPSVMRTNLAALREGLGCDG